MNEVVCIYTSMKSLKRRRWFERGRGVGSGGGSGRDCAEGEWAEFAGDFMSCCPTVVEFEAKEPGETANRLENLGMWKFDVMCFILSLSISFTESFVYHFIKCFLNCVKL